MKFTPHNVLGLFKQAGKDWSEDKAPRLGAALAYYTIFSLAPLIIIAISIVGFIFGHDAAREQIFGQVNGLVGEKGGEAIQAMLVATDKPHQGFIATVIAIATLLVGSTGVFIQLQDALNTVWDVKQKPGQGIKGFIMNRVLSFAMVFGIGFLLLVSLVLSAGLAAMGKYMVGLMPGMQMVAQVLNFSISFGIITLLFAMIFKFLPDVKIAWKDVWIGAAFTALLFTIGKYALGLYLGKSAVSSAYGAAGSLVVVLLWVYWSSQILFFGAELTQVYANEYGAKVVPKEHAVMIVQPQEQELPQGQPASSSTGGGKRTPAPQPRRKPEFGGALPALLILAFAFIPKPKPKGIKKLISKAL